MVMAASREQERARERESGIKEIGVVAHLKKERRVKESETEKKKLRFFDWTRRGKTGTRGTKNGEKERKNGN